MLQQYFEKLYRRTMDQAYRCAFDEIVSCLRSSGRCLDCGANAGHSFDRIRQAIPFDADRYSGIEWNEVCANRARSRGLDVTRGDLNAPLPYEQGQFRCVFGLSVLEHLLNGCAFIKDCYRVLEEDGKLVLLTPNISTYFTMALLLVGKMPSSGPHPDSNLLLGEEEVLKVRGDDIKPDLEHETPVHRHIVVFSYRVLKRYLHMVGFKSVEGHAFGVYPFPNFIQPLLERIDPWHCHQMVFVARK